MPCLQPITRDLFDQLSELSKTAHPSTGYLEERARTDRKEGLPFRSRRNLGLSGTNNAGYQQGSDRDDSFEPLGEGV